MVKREGFRVEGTTYAKKKKKEVEVLAFSPDYRLVIMARA